MPANREEVWKACAGSIETFGKLFMAKALSAATPDFHKLIYKDLMNNDIKKLGIVAPRGHSKSTVVSVIFPMWRILFKPKEEDLMILLISESQSQAVNFLSIIKNNFTTNPMILHYFGNLEGPKWTEDEIVTSNGAKLIAKGTGQRVRGMLMGNQSITRPNLIILDDFESETNSGTPEAIDKNKKWLTKAVEPSLSDDGRLIAIGTIISERAYLKDIERDPIWTTHFYQAIMDGKPLWPERFSMKRLMEIKQSLENRGESDAFWQEYMNMPVNEETKTFKRETYRYWDGEFKVFDNIQPAIRLMDSETNELEPTWTPLTVCIGVDLAISESHTADYTVIAPVGMSPSERRYLLPYERFKSSDIDVIVEKMLDACELYRADRINIETVQFQQAVATAFRKGMLDRGIYVSVTETKPRTSKDSRIKSLQPLFNMGIFFHKEDMVHFEAELNSFPRGAHDDILDAVYMANALLTTPDVEPFEGDHVPTPEFAEEESWLVL